MTLQPALLYALLLLPVLLAAVAFALPSARLRPFLLPLGGGLHLAVLGVLIAGPTATSADGWLVLDPLGKLILATISALFFVASWYAPGYLAHYPERPNRVFIATLLGFLTTTSLVVLSHHLGLMWVAMEATTLVTAPLVYFNRNRKSLEATWKYLLICSVGIALALLGSLFLGYASVKAGLPSSLLFEDLLTQAPTLSKPWLHAAFVFLLVGYGTKMGLAPMHAWKPDVYGEAPGLVGALLAGGLTNCAFLALLRVARIVGAAGEGHSVRQTFVALGLVSMAFAAAFMVRQRDLKRMLAWSSVEHMGVLMLGIGIGGAGTFAALLHLMNNAFTKGALFLTAANIHRVHGTKLMAELGGVLRRMPASGTLFVAGFFAITGSPPFGPFVSQFTMLGELFATGRWLVAAAFLGLLFIVFLGMGACVVGFVQGRPKQPAGSTADGAVPAAVVAEREGWWSILPPLAMLAAVLMMGLHIPAPLAAFIQEAAGLLEVLR